MKTTQPKPYATSTTDREVEVDSPFGDLDKDDQVRIASDPNARRFRALKDWSYRLLEIGDQYVREVTHPNGDVHRYLVEVVKIETGRDKKIVHLSNKYKFDTRHWSFDDATIDWIYRPLAKFREFSFR